MTAPGGANSAAMTLALLRGMAIAEIARAFGGGSDPAPRATDDAPSRPVEAPRSGTAPAIGQVRPADAGLPGGQSPAPVLAELAAPAPQRAANPLWLAGLSPPRAMQNDAVLPDLLRNGAVQTPAQPPQPNVLPGPLRAAFHPQAPQAAAPGSSTTAGLPDAQALQPTPRPGFTPPSSAPPVGSAFLGVQPVLPTDGTAKPTQTTQQAAAITTTTQPTNQTASLAQPPSQPGRPDTSGNAVRMGTQSQGMPIGDPASARFPSQDPAQLSPARFAPAIAQQSVEPGRSFLAAPPTSSGPAQQGQGPSPVDGPVTHTRQPGTVVQEGTITVRDTPAARDAGTAAPTDRPQPTPNQTAVQRADLPPLPPDTSRPVQVLHAALSAAITESASFGSFPFMALGREGNSASLVIFNAAMIPSWPPAFRLDQAMGGAKALQVGGAQLSQMTPEEAAEYIAKMAAGFDFLLKVKKRLSATVAEEKEMLLGLFSFLGAALDALVRGLRMAVEQSLEQQEMLAEVQIERGQKPGKRGRQRLNL